MWLRVGVYWYLEIIFYFFFLLAYPCGWKKYSLCLSIFSILFSPSWLYLTQEKVPIRPQASQYNSLCLDMRQEVGVWGRRSSWYQLGSVPGALRSNTFMTSRGRWGSPLVGNTGRKKKLHRVCRPGVYFYGFRQLHYYRYFLLWWIILWFLIFIWGRTL